MKYITPAMLAHLSQPYQTMTGMALVQLANGTTLAFTEHDKNVTYNLEGYIGSAAAVGLPPWVVGTGSQTYLATSGYTGSDIASGSDLAVDNLEIDGLPISPYITEEALRTGVWDNANFLIFQVNWKDLSNTMGAVMERTGNLGDVTVDRGVIKTELFGLTKAYARSIGQLTSAACRADLGDARCTVDLGPLTVTSTLTDVSPDMITLYDTARTEPGPTDGVAITDVSNANPGIVTLAVAPAPIFVEGQAVVISGVVGPNLVNSTLNVRAPATDGLSFSLGIDTSDTSTYPPYTSGGTATPLGGNAGYFDYGKISMTGGPNAGFSMDVKAYAPGVIILQLPFPYLCTIGDSYTMTPGCAKDLIVSCKGKFDNVNNFRGESWLRGIDWLVQTGRHN